MPLFSRTKKVKSYTPINQMERPSALLTKTENEQRIEAIVQQARDDWHDNLLELYWAYKHAPALARHSARFKAVIGEVASSASSWKMIAFFIVVGIAGGAGLIIDKHWPWWADIFAAAGYAMVIFVGYGRYKAFYSAFVKVYCVERADFTDPSQVTGLVTIWLPRLVYYYRPDVWRGNNGQNGFQSSGAYCVVQTGVDNVMWDTQVSKIGMITKDAAIYGNWDLSEWCLVQDGRLISTLRNPSDYYYLPRDSFMANCVSMKLRRAWCRALQRNGALMGKIERGKISILDGYWAWIYSLVMAGLALLFFMLATE